MQRWLAGVASAKGPKYIALADAIDQAVRSGILRAGERLPPQREVAALLAIDLTTVTRAFGIARDAGLIEGSGRLGSFVRNAAQLPSSSDGEVSGMIMPPQPAFALLPDAMRTGLAKLLRAGGGSPLLQYQPSGGARYDRRQAAAALSDRGVPTSEDDVVITAGGQNALHAILATVLGPGDAICAGASTYPGLLGLAARLGRRVLPLPVGAEGIDIEAFHSAARAGAKALYIVPTNDNPTTATLGLEARRHIADIARRYGVTIIEDDAYGQLPAQPLPPITALAPERCWHIASVSKIVSPVLRVAHVRAPSAGDAAQLAVLIQETAVMAPPLNAALVSLWLREGRFAELVAAVRQEGIVRQAIAAKYLAGLRHAAHPEGYHIWLRLPTSVRPVEIAAAIRSAGLSIVPGEAFAVDRSRADPDVRLSIGGAIDHDHLRRAFERLQLLLGKH